MKSTTTETTDRCIPPLHCTSAHKRRTRPNQQRPSVIHVTTIFAARGCRSRSQSGTRRPGSRGSRPNRARGRTYARTTLREIDIESEMGGWEARAGYLRRRPAAAGAGARSGGRAWGRTPARRRRGSPGLPWRRRRRGGGGVVGVGVEAWRGERGKKTLVDRDGPTPWNQQQQQMRLSLLSPSSPFYEFLLSFAFLFFEFPLVTSQLATLSQSLFFFCCCLTLYSQQNLI